MAAMLRGAAALQHHRGPDADGAWSIADGDWEIGLAHTRLSILDLSDAGAQPMRAAIGDAVLVYNGEIYNHAALRKDLERYPFRGHSDTETLLAGHVCAGDGFDTELRGMYAYALARPADRGLRLARDPFGMKPLFYAASEEEFVFASEVRTLLRLLPRSWRLAHGALGDYLRTGSPAEAPIVEGIAELGAGESLELRWGGDRLAWSRRSDIGLQCELRGPQTRREAVEQVRAALLDSVARHTMSDVPVGMFLSGGVDSTALLALLRQAGAGAARTFNVSFGESRFSESVQAREMAVRFDAVHEEIELTAAGLLADVPEALAAMDQPSIDGFNSYVVSRAVAGAGIKVALSGLGGDELFAGYPSFARQRALGPWRGALRAAAPIGAMLEPMLGKLSTAAGKAAGVLRTGGRPEAVHALSRRLFAPDQARRLAPDADPVPSAPLALPEDPVNAISLLEAVRYMRHTLLRDTDRMSMAHSLEVRVPFVDLEVWRVVYPLPGEWKMEAGRPKPLLLDAVGEVPDAVWNRPKMGFTLPFADWLRGEMRAEVESAFSDAAALEACGLRPDAAREVWNGFLRSPGRSRWSHPWSLFVLARWCQRQGVTI